MAKETATKKKDFMIDVHIDLETNLIVSANSLEEALEISKTLKLQDYVTLNGDHNDSEIHVRGVFEA